jgi:endonuclease/exonuclease/phosphatase family metal-dependent hydrolase
MRALVLAAALASVGFAPGARAAEPHELSVMAFNIWYGGVQVDFETVAKAIRAANPDVVAVQEPEGNLRRLAEAAGYGYVDESLHLMSRFPIYPGEQDGLRFGYIALDPLHVAAVAGLHLTSSPYGPEAVRDGSSVDEVLTLERETRLPEIEPYVAALGAVAAKGVPTIVLGDFNTPSHQDWTEAAVAAGKVKYAVDWPVTRALADASFVDSYRAMHPDPVAVPGKTWTAGTPPPRIRPIETLDRIDMIWSSGPATAIASSVVGETGGPDVDVGVDPWPSDHRAVVSRFTLTPAEAPALVAVDRQVVVQGERIVARYVAPGNDETRQIAILPGAGDKPQALMSLPMIDGSDHRAGTFGTATLEPGRYRAAVINGAGVVEAEAPFWILGRDAFPSVDAPETVAVGAPIHVTWTNAPANRLDWIGVYPAGVADLYGYAGFLYTGARSTGEMDIDAEALGAELEPGDYDIRLMLDDGYSVLASTPVKIVASPTE